MNLFICLIAMTFIIYGIVIFINGIVNVYKRTGDGTESWIQLLICFILGIILLMIIFLSSIVFTSLCTLIELIQTAIVELIA